MTSLIPFHDLVQDFMAWDDRRQLRPAESQSTSRVRPLCPLLEVYEADGCVKVNMELPGIKAYISINLDSLNNSLTISGEFKDESKKEHKGRMYSDRRSGFFSRTVTLPAPADTEKIDAKLADGVLTLDIRTAQGKGVRKIPIA
ncbi:Heat shock protein 16 [Neolecta irregularis DAH-3]|uniref:Heat shock protein 16 n=1 Tax=Neolecta irregularis (strain DAH-3) TaxID=1198029 RepID=A0A1U7LRA1_NEOID|nr:Heat shock protein 16 [Neolecta irregularis DAH-3]|eukprot:OLL25187.1 Heat shock protein 16 [Neolecta irregularis DAH-3]